MAAKKTDKAPAAPVALTHEQLTLAGKVHRARVFEAIREGDLSEEVQGGRRGREECLVFERRLKGRLQPGLAAPHV
jgi:hypothetical protein